MNDESERLADEILVLESQSGQDESVQSLIRPYQERFWRHARSLAGDPDAVWEVTQEAWMGIVKGLSHIREPANFRECRFRILGFVERLDDISKGTLAFRSERTARVVIAIFANGHDDTHLNTHLSRIAL